MIISKIYRVLCPIVFVFGTSICVSQVLNEESGIWSKEAQVMKYVGNQRYLEVISPNGEAKAVISNFSLAVVANGKILQGTENVGVSSIAELGWSPDSKAFFITQSLGGNVGEFITTIFQVGTDSVRKLDISEMIFKDFEQHYKCKEIEVPNIGAVKWIDSSSSILVVAEVPPHSSCPDMGKVRGYAVDIPSGKIIREVELEVLLENWKNYLGSRFNSLK